MNIEILKKNKKALGLTNAQLAEKSGVSLGTINKIFAGSIKNPRIDTLRAIEGALGNPPVNYLDEEIQSISFRETVAEDIYANMYTVDDLYALPEDRRVELIDGQFYDLASPRISHQRIISRLLKRILDYIEDHGGSCLALTSPVGVRLDRDEYTEVQPDIIVVCDESKIRDRYILGAPDFVAEVVSSSTKVRDYMLKAGKYTKAGVKEYWIVDLKDEKVTVFVKDAEDDFKLETYRLSDKITMALFPELIIDMAEESRGIKY